MNSVSRVACINEFRENAGRELKALMSDLDTCVNICVRTIDSSGECPAAADRLAVEEDVEGMVVEISVWTSTSISNALYTYGRTCSGRDAEGSQVGDVTPSMIMFFRLLIVGPV